MNGEGSDSRRRSTDKAWAAVQELIDAANGVALGAICYGSVVNRAATHKTSALDVVLIVDSYADFWQGIEAAGAEPQRMRWLSPFLAPTTILIGGPPALAKISIVRSDQYCREMSADARDHFLRGRLSQQVDIAWSRDEEAFLLMRRTVADARALSIRWVPARVPDPTNFTVVEFIETLICVSYKHEIRPESRQRARQVAEAQSESLVDIYRPILVEAVANGLLNSPAPDKYSQLPGTPSHRRFFAISRVRFIARLPRYMAMTSGWLPYLSAKIRRRTNLGRRK